MAKRLTMAEIDTLLTVHKAGHSNREIAALLGVNRETIGKHLGRLKAQNQPNAPTGKATDDPNGYQPNAPTGNEAGSGHADAATEIGWVVETPRISESGQAIPAKRVHRETPRSTRSDTGPTRPPAPGSGEIRKIRKTDPCQHASSRR